MKRYSAKKEKQKIIINADDYGISPLFNKGILELAQAKLVTSVSVMIRRKYIRKADVKKFNELSWGLHLELKNRDSKKEIRSQINKFKLRFGKLPSHLDSHYHSHLTHYNLPLVVEIAKEHNLPVRSYFEETRGFMKRAEIKTPDRFLDWQYGKIDELIKRTIAEKISGLKTIELVFHPGYYDKRSKVRYNGKREREMEFMKSQKFRNFLQKFDLANYSNI